MNSSPNVLRLGHDLMIVHTAYNEVRGRIQKLSSRKPITTKRLMKCSERGFIEDRDAIAAMNFRMWRLGLPRKGVRRMRPKAYIAYLS